MTSRSTSDPAQAFFAVTIPMCVFQKPEAPTSSSPFT